MVATYLLYVFVAFGSKAVLALVVCYLLLPTERTCDGCDAETLPVRMGPAGRALARLARGRLQRRWCPGCGRESMTRTGGAVPVGARAGGAARPASR